MNASDPVDNWRPGWNSFRDFLQDTTIDRRGLYLTELDHDTGARRDWTRAAWRAHVANTSAGLAERGVGPGDSVAMLAGNSADALAVAYACWTQGWVYLPLNAHESVDRQSIILNDAATRILVHSPAAAARAAELSQATGIPAVPSSKVATASADPVHSEPGGGMETPALRVYTSGTTGEPKGVELSVGNLLADCDALSKVSGWNPDSRVLVVLPIHHVNGLVVSCLQAWYVGGSAVLCDRFRSEWFWEDAEIERATVASLVPTLLEFLIAQGGRRAPDGFREVYCGAGPLMTETVLGFETAFGVPVRHLYGLSETTAVATMMPRLPDRERHSWYADHGFPSIGAPVPHVAVAIHDAEGQQCPEGTRGEIVIRGATVMRGYAGRPEATAQTLRDGWFHSGDEGFCRTGSDGAPYFFVTGRLKELIIRGGVNISPFQVDEVINAHPAVQFGLAVPFENRFYGEEIAAYVVRAAPVTEQEILDFCAERLDFAYRPKVVIFGEDVPFTATGKAKRLSLKQQLADQLNGYRDVQFRRNRHPARDGNREDAET